jgi:hypothetical protein
MGADAKTTRHHYYSASIIHIEQSVRLVYGITMEMAPVTIEWMTINTSNLK